MGTCTSHRSSSQIGIQLPTPHEMSLTRRLDPGFEEWSCVQCGRRLLLRRPPAFEKIVLERGDEWAAHVGGANGLQMRISTARRVQPVDLSAAERGWLAAHGIDWEPEQGPCTDA